MTSSMATPVQNSSDVGPRVHTSKNPDKFSDATAPQPNKVIPDFNLRTWQAKHYRQVNPRT